MHNFVKNKTIGKVLLFVFVTTTMVAFQNCGNRFRSNNNTAELATVASASSLTIDKTAPVISEFSVSIADSTSQIISSGPSLSDGKSSGFHIVASDNRGIVGYLISEQPDKPTASSSGWMSDYMTDFVLENYSGSHPIYLWVKDAAGNISDEAVSFAVVNLIDEAQKDIPECTDARQVTTGKQLICHCTVAATNINSNTGGTIWGNDIYTDDSPICRAAVHYGAIGASREGNVIITKIGGCSSYSSVQRNGLRSSSYNEWPGSYYFSGFRGANSCVSLASATAVDETAPVILDFKISQQSISSRKISGGITITVQDNVQVIGYMLTENSKKPQATDSRWSETAPQTFEVYNFVGVHYIYAWTKDAAGNVSAPAQVAISNASM